MPTIPDATKRRIVKRLRKGGDGINQIAREFGVSSGVVSRLRDKIAAGCAESDTAARNHGLVWSLERGRWITAKTVEFAARAALVRHEKRTTPGTIADLNRGLGPDDAARELVEREAVWGQKQQAPPKPGALLLRALRLAAVVYFECPSGTSCKLERRFEAARAAWQESLRAERTTESAGGTRVALPGQGPVPAGSDFSLT